jgi:hypothetical protein
MRFWVFKNRMRQLSKKHFIIIVLVVISMVGILPFQIIGSIKTVPKYIAAWSKQ